MKLLHGDCLEVMATLDAESVDSIVTDPPYGLSFMGRDWDHGIPAEAFWREALRVAKPGAHLLAFGGSRTYHRLACAIEDAGWEIRDCIMWVYGSGFPKSHDVSKAIDREAGIEREVVGIEDTHYDSATRKNDKKITHDFDKGRPNALRTITAPATEAAKQWQGWGTALKPAVEVIMLARKPLNADTERDIIIENLTRMEAQLWLLLHAKTAGQDSTLNQLDLGEAFATAQWNAGGLTSTLADLCGQTDMSRFESALTTSLNTVSSWLSILEECWRLGSTFTTEMKTRPIIDLKTLRCLLSETTLEGIIKVELQAPGSALSALPVSVYLNAVKKNMEGIQTLFAIENAISQASKTGLRPDFEPIIVARKPLVGTIAANVQQYGTGAINVDGCRVAMGSEKPPTGSGSPAGWCIGSKGNNGNITPLSGRWPANFIHDGSDEVVRLFPVTTSGGGDKHGRKKSTFCASTDWEAFKGTSSGGDSGSAARFFYTAKASKRDRDEGCEGLEERGKVFNGQSAHSAGLAPGSVEDKFTTAPARNFHPTVKPTDLMRYLCRLVTPPGGTVLDPFMGSGSTGKGATLEGFNFIGIEQNAEYLEIAKARIQHAIDSASEKLFSDSV